MFKRSVLLFFLLFSFPLQAKPLSLGLGLGLSSQTSGLSVFSDLHNQVFFQGLFGITNPMLVADVAKEVPINSSTTGYIGGGLLLHPGPGVGLRVPMGVYFRSPESPVMLNVDVAPSLVTVGESAYSVVDVTVGLRYMMP